MIEQDDEEYEYEFEPDNENEELNENGEVEEEYQPTEEELYEYAKCLGIDPEEDQQYLYIALEGLQAPVPEPWLACKNEEGDVFFHNPETEEISWNHPLDDFYRDLFQEIKTRDLKQKKKAENEKKMRKTAGKLQGLAPLKSQLSNKQTEIEEIRIIEKVEKEKFLPNKAANKLTNISGISSNHSKKNDSFLEDEIQNREASFDLNNSSFHSIKGKNDKYSPLKDRKLRLPKDCSNKDIDKYYQIKIDELINEKEKESLEKKRDLVKKQNQLQKELEDDIPTKIADLNEKKEKLIQNFLNLEKEDEFLKEKLIKVNKEVLMKKLEELKKLQEKKKNVSRENLIGSNEKFLEDFEHEQEQVVNLKKKQIQTLKNNQNSLLESEKIKTNKILEDKKNQIEKEIKLNYQKSFEKFKNQEFNNIENLKKKELNKMSEQFEEKNQKISSESSEKYKSNYQEIYKRKFELEKKTIQHEFNELLLEFQINEERNMGIKLNKYKSHLLESELIALQNQFFEERKTLNKIYQKKLDLTKLQNKSQIKKEEHFNVRDKIFESFRRELNELVDFLAQNPNKNNENFQNIQKNDGQNLRDLELFVLQERMEIQSQEEEKTRLNGILKKQMDKLKDYQNKLFSIDLKINTVFQINANFEQTLDNFNQLLTRNIRKGDYLNHKAFILSQISDMISNKKISTFDEIIEKKNIYQNLNEDDEQIQTGANETSVGSQFVEDWKKLYQRLSENLKKNKINYLEENVSSDKKIFGGKSSLFVSPKIKFSGSSVKFFGS